MKQLRTKVLLSAFVLIFALVATIGSTFAWFTIATSVSVDTMELNVSTSDSLLIRVYQGEETGVAGDPTLLDAATYKTFIPLADITEAEGLYEDLATWRMTPVTVVNAAYNGIITSGFNTLTTPNTDFLRALSAANPTNFTNNAAGSVIEIKFWVLSQGSTAAPLVLEDLTIAADNTIEAKDAVVDAVRVAIQATDLTTPGSRYIFGLTNDYGFTYVQDLPGYYDGDPVVENAFNAIAPANVTLINASALNGLYVKSAGLGVTNASVAAADIDDASVIYTLAQNVPTLVTVTVFVEGWAAETTNAIIAAAFDISWKFTLNL